MKVEVINSYTRQVETVKLNLLQRLSLKLLGYAKIGERKYPGWRGYIPFYVVKCKKHGLYVDYPHGYRQYFNCPRCLVENDE